MNDTHRISIEQNEPKRLELLRAQRLFYGRAKLLQNCLAVAALVLPFVGLLFGSNFPAIRPYLGFGSICLLLLDVALIAPRSKADCKRGAKVQEKFDTEVLGLPWNKLVAGSPLDEEEVREIAPAPLTDAEKSLLVDWYEPDISKLPLPLGRLLCQRTNASYDLRLRKKSADFAMGAVAGLFVVLIVVGLYQGLKSDELILGLLLPALPLASFVLREYRKQLDTVETVTTIKGEVEKVWEKALSGTPFDELTATARSLQDAIYRHRASNPLVFDWLYFRMRKQSEDLAKHSAERLVAEAQAKLNLKEA